MSISSKPIVVLFAGQGAQAVGMGKDLFETYSVAREMFERANEILGYSLTEVMFEGPAEELTKTSRCQPALYLHGLACLEVLKEKIPDLRISAAAGLSLGEFTAHAAARSFDFETGLALVSQRGRFMEDACRENPGTMAAMIGGAEEDVRKLAESVGVDVANLNCPGQTVLSGTKDGITAALAGAKGAGVRMGKELDVAGAYHSSLMQPAQEKLATELAEAAIGEPAFPVISNVEATEVSGRDQIRQTLESQVTGSVCWSESMQGLLDAGHETFVELGPGGILAGLMNRIQRGTQVLAAGDVESIEAAAEEIAAVTA
ncbi:MAG: ACP S-malonyltransferase [Verrucomicrobiales bacterium]